MRRTLLLGAGALLALAASGSAHVPWLVWNASNSVPIGLYRVDTRAPLRGELALIKLNLKIALLADQRGYLPISAHLLKPVAATSGDRVCRIGRAVVVRGSMAATADAKDSQRRPLVKWQACHVLMAGQLFVLGPTPDSFDSRYFGPVTADRVIGRAHAVWTLK